MTLVVSDLTVDHGAIRAIDGVSFRVEEGELAAIIGANGAGKTTLLRSLSGLTRATLGSATWQGHELLYSKPEKLVRLGVSQVSEGKSVIPELTVDENLLLGALWRRNSDESRATREMILETFPRLAERISQPADTLSGGERAMLAIGRTLMSKPRLLLLDEPSLGLAPLIVEQIFTNIRDFTSQMGLTVILVEQNAMSALRIADVGIVLNLGRIAAMNSAQQLIFDPQVRAAYLGY
jgi:branched-chain amino acid transport system ATP-binding protein